MRGWENTAVLSRVPLVRLTTTDGVQGFGLTWANPETFAPLLGAALDSLITPEHGVTPAGLPVEYALWDVLGRSLNLPVYALAAKIAGRPVPESLRVPCYDTSLYFDDLHLVSAEAAAALMAAEAREGLTRGHRAFKLKVGRGARHLPLEEGTQRDIAIIRAVRAAVGPEATLLLDANNGYNLNLTKRVLAETEECAVTWIEEAFHEDPVLYRDLKEWMVAWGLKTWIADGEGDASSHLLDWTKDGLIDVIQYDIFGHGFTRWLTTGAQCDAMNVRSAPHHYGAHLGNYVTAHLAPAIQNFTFVEWDETRTPGLAAPGYTIEEGRLTVPNAPGFGLTLDDPAFRQAAAKGGGTLE